MLLRRMLWRRNIVFMSFVCMIVYGAYFVSHYEILEDTHGHSHDHDHDHDHGHGHGHSPSAKEEKGVGDDRLAALRAQAQHDKEHKKALMGRAFEPYTIPPEVDYETITAILPQMWKHALENPLPKSCEFITFDHNPNMDFGESMFIYASLFGVARKSKRVPFIDHKLGFPLAQVFQFKQMPLAGKSVDGSFTKYRESLGCCRFDHMLLNIPCGRKAILSGKLQSYHYFHAYHRELLSTEFVFQDTVAKQCSKEFHDVLARNRFSETICQLVGVHVRHPDELTSNQKARGHVGASTDFLKRAFTHFQEKYSESSCLLFLVTGKEGAKVKALMSNLTSANSSSGTIVKTIFLQPQSEAVRLCMLTMCQDAIVTTGATSWWMAYIAQQRNDGQVVYQKKYAVPGSDLMKEMKKSDYFLDSWVGL